MVHKQADKLAALGRRIADFFSKLFNPRRGSGSGFEPEYPELESAPSPDEFLAGSGSGRGINTGGDSVNSNFNPDYNVLRGREPRVYGDGLETVSPVDNEVYGRIKYKPQDKDGVIRESI